jgi:hypothetical protein
MKKLFARCLKGFGITAPITLILVLINIEYIPIDWKLQWIKSWFVAGTLATLITGYIQPGIQNKLYSFRRKRETKKD